MLKSLICMEAVLVACYVLDVIVIFGLIGLYVWFTVKNSKKKQERNNLEQSGVQQVNQDTFVLPSEEVEVEEPVVKNEDNAVVHFVNQISDINEEANTELNSNAVIVNHEVEAHEKKILKKDEIENFVVIDGKKKVKTEEDKVTAVNRGTDAFKNATNFVNTIKSEQSEEKVETKKTTKKSK